MSIGWTFDGHLWWRSCHLLVILVLKFASSLKSLDQRQTVHLATEAPHGRCVWASSSCHAHVETWIQTVCEFRYCIIKLRSGNTTAFSLSSCLHKTHFVHFFFKFSESLIHTDIQASFSMGFWTLLIQAQDHAYQAWRVLRLLRLLWHAKHCVCTMSNSAPLHGQLCNGIYLWKYYVKLSKSQSSFLGTQHGYHFRLSFEQ